MVCNLRDTLLTWRWAQQLVCSLGKVKSLFGAMWQAKQAEHDEITNNTPAAKKKRGETLLRENDEAEAAILASMAKEL